MTCLILACCRCDRVPALLFTRPYTSRRRWNRRGEIYLVNPPSADMIPKWPLKVIDATKSPIRNKASDKGLLSWNSCNLSPSIKDLCQQNIISIEHDGNDFFFCMVSPMREETWEQTSTQDRLLLWFDLLRLVVYSSPDAYAENFWQKTFRCCKAVIDSTLLPFLSVLEWDHLEQHEAL